MEHLVHNCRECPLKNYILPYKEEELITVCSFAKCDEDIGNYIKDKSSPTWCPLKKEPITIKIEQHGR